MSARELVTERDLGDGDRHEPDRSYRLGRIGELPPPPELPVRETHHEVIRFERHEVTLPASEWEMLRFRARHHGLGPAEVVLAAYAEVIGTWSRRPHFTLSVRVPSRLRSGEHIAGDLTTHTPLAVDQSGTAPFTDRARALAVRLRRELRRRRFSRAELPRENGPRRGRGIALMPVAFTCALGSGAGQAGGVTKSGRGTTANPHTWIDCHAMGRDDGLEIGLGVRAGVFPDGLIPDLVEAFHRVLAELARDEVRWFSWRPVRLPAGQRARGGEVDAPAAPAPELLLQDRVCTQASHMPDRPALLWPGGSMSYGELLCRARAVAARLGELRPGELVAVVMDKGWEQVAAVLGVSLTGAAYVPIDPTDPLEQMLAGTGAREVLTQSWIDEATLWPARLRVTIVERLDPITESSPIRRAGQDDLAYTAYTSGTTGAPQCVMITHRAAVNSVEGVTGRFGIGAADRVLGLAELGSEKSVYDIFGVLGAGGTLVLPSAARQADPRHWAELITTHGVTLWNSAPAQLRLLSQHLDAVPTRGLASLRLALLSGDWIPVTLPGQIRKQLPRLRMIGLGGATEAAIWSTYHPIEEVAPGTRSIPYGRPLANQSCHVLDQAMRPRPDWVPGELYIGGASLARGYLVESENTHERFVIHPVTGQRLFRTGDLARYLPGGVIELLGRPDDVPGAVNGHSVDLATVESAVLSHPTVGSVAVVADPAPALDHRLVAFVTGVRRPHPGDDELDLRCVAIEAARAVPRTISHRQVMLFIGVLNRAALLSMVGALRSVGLFRKPRDAHHSDEILANPRLEPAHRDVIHRWLRVLVDEELLIQDADGRMRLAQSLGSRPATRAWDKVTALHAEEIFPAEMLGYLRASAERLPAVLTGALDPSRIFLPEAGSRIARALYADNALARYLNEAVAAALRRITASRPHGVPLRVLEVGAGTGATTARIIAALSGRALDYLVTDVSQCVLDKAEETFRDCPQMRFGLFDINTEYRSQGLAPHSVDVILCTGALTTARDIGESVRRMRELLVAGGWLVLVEPTRERYEIMTSQALLVNSTRFLTREQWLATLRRPGDEVTLCLPAAADPLSRLGQHIFVTQVKRDTEPVDTTELTAHLASRLPAYPVLAGIQVLDELPLRRNGKLDRARLRSWLPDDTVSHGAARC